MSDLEFWVGCSFRRHGATLQCIKNLLEIAIVRWRREFNSAQAREAARRRWRASSRICPFDRGNIAALEHCLWDRRASSFAALLFWMGRGPLEEITTLASIKS